MESELEKMDKKLKNLNANLRLRKGIYSIENQWSFEKCGKDFLKGDEFS
jgi:hypothetical protein